WKEAQHALITNPVSASDLSVFCVDAPLGEVQTVLDFLDQKKPNIHPYCMENESPLPHFIQQCIEAGQEAIAVKLIEHYQGSKKDLVAHIEAQGLLHQAAQSGMRTLFSAMLTQLKQKGATPEERFDLMMKCYGPTSSVPVYWN